MAQLNLKVHVMDNGESKWRKMLVNTNDLSAVIETESKEHCQIVIKGFVCTVDKTFSEMNNYYLKAKQHETPAYKG